MQFASYGPLENRTQQPHVLLRAHSKSAKALRTEPRNYRLLLQPLQHQQQRRMKVSELPCGHKYNSRAVFLLVWACRHVCNCYTQNPLPFSQDFLLGKPSICANKLKASIHPSIHGACHFLRLVTKGIPLPGETLSVSVRQELCTKMIPFSFF